MSTALSSSRHAAEDAARERLRAARLPAPVLIHALGRRQAPSIASRAVASYWHRHPVRADRLSRALAGLGGPPEGWTWRLGRGDEGPARTVRTPPAPFRDGPHRAEPGTCCICGQPVFRFGWHRDLWGDDARGSRARWHGCCVAAWALWQAPHRHRTLIARLQRRRCAASGDRLARDYEIDHRVPLHRVWREHRDAPWPGLLRFWGFPNLGAVAPAAHAAKSAREAAGRAAARRASAEGVAVAAR